MSTTTTAPPVVPERFQTREELDQYIETKTTAGLKVSVKAWA